MAIIYTYPVKTTPAGDDLILISDSADSNNTKQVKVSTLPSSGGGGTPASPVNSVQFNNAGAFGGSANLTFATNTLAVTHTVDIKGDGTNAGKLKLYCENTSTPHAVTIEGPAHAGAAAYTLKLPSPAPANNQILEYTTSGNLGWINTPSGSSGISFSGTTANGIATYSNSTTAAVSSVFTVLGNKLSAPAGTLADPSIEVGAVGGLYAASGGITLAHNGTNAIGVTSSSIVNYKLTQFQAGLKFGATGETLSSYEEGSWTPASPNANTISSATGKYTKVGNTVFASFAFTMTGSTTVSLSGLPFSGVYTSGNKGTSIISVNNCASVQGQIVGGQMVTATSFSFNAYTGSGAGLPTKLQTTTSSLYQTSGGTYAGIIIYQTS